jgi:hypothetical protein
VFIFFLPETKARRPGLLALGRLTCTSVPSIRPGRALAEIVQIYGIRHWIEQSCKQVKDGLGWADFQVRSDVAIRRHQALVNCAFSN